MGIDPGESVARREGIENLHLPPESPWVDQSLTEREASGGLVTAGLSMI
jgi:hypothetical protein